MFSLDKRPTILVVDDTHANLLALRRLLKKQDVNLVEASSGNEALAQSLQLRNLALILLDVQMPGMDGYEVARFLQGEEQTQNIPIIFLTAVHRDENYVIEGYTSGAVDYITKPIDPYILNSKVRIFLDLWRAKFRLEQEIIRRKKAEEQVYELAHTDELTALPNRRALMKAFAREISRAERLKQRFYVLMIDLDGFKGINDSQGHDVGDAVLITTALRLRELIRDYDVAARVGGDEFVVLLCDITAPKVLEKRTNDFIKTLTQPFIYKDASLQVGVSLGAASFPDNGTTIDALLRHADKSMYEAKKSGGSRVKA